MKYKGYLARVEFDEQADLFHGEVINIRDVITFQGRSVEELRQAFEESVEDYLALCSQRGEEPEPPFSGRITLRLSPERHRRIVMVAQKSGKDIATWATEVLDDAVGS